MVDYLAILRALETTQPDTPEPEPAINNPATTQADTQEPAKLDKTIEPAIRVNTLAMVKECFDRPEYQEKRQTVSKWPKPRQEQFFKLAKGYCNSDRGFGFRAIERTIPEAIEKAFIELKPFCKEQQK